LCSPRREPETPEVQMTKSQHGVKTRPKFNYAGWVEHARLSCQSLSLRTMVRVRVPGHGVRVVVDCHVLASACRVKRVCLLKRVWLFVWCVSCRVMSCRVLYTRVQWLIGRPCRSFFAIVAPIGLHTHPALRHSFELISISCLLIVLLAHARTRSQRRTDHVVACVFSPLFARSFADARTHDRLLPPTHPDMAMTRRWASPCPKR
jgi:hypothetical protein